MITIGKVQRAYHRGPTDKDQKDSKGTLKGRLTIKIKSKNKTQEEKDNSLEKEQSQNLRLPKENNEEEQKEFKDVKEE